MEKKGFNWNNVIGEQFYYVIKDEVRKCVVEAVTINRMVYVSPIPAARKDNFMLLLTEGRLYKNIFDALQELEKNKKRQFETKPSCDHEKGVVKEMSKRSIIRKAHQEAFMCNSSKEVHVWIDWFDKELAKQNEIFKKDMNDFTDNIIQIIKKI